METNTVDVEQQSIAQTYDVGCSCSGNAPFALEVLAINFNLTLQVLPRFVASVQQANFARSKETKLHIC